MIVSFACSDTRDLAEGLRVPRFRAFEKVARRKLRQLEIAGTLDDLRIPPGNRLERLKGTRKGLMSIRINEQFRICFRSGCCGDCGLPLRGFVTKQLSPITPGEILNEDFLEPMGITKYRLAKEIAVPPQRIGDIVAGKRAITADTDLRLCKFFGLSEGYWLRAQVAHDIEVAKRDLSPTLANIQPWTA